MKLTPPKKISFYISAILGLLGFIGYLVSIPVLSVLSFWLVLAGLILLGLSVSLKGL